MRIIRIELLYPSYILHTEIRALRSRVAVWFIKLQTLQSLLSFAILSPKNDKMGTVGIFSLHELVWIFLAFSKNYWKFLELQSKILFNEKMGFQRNYDYSALRKTLPKYKLSFFSASKILSLITRLNYRP